MRINLKNEKAVAARRLPEICGRLVMLAIAYLVSTVLVLDYSDPSVIFDLAQMFSLEHPISAIRDIGIGFIAIGICNSAMVIREVGFLNTRSRIVTGGKGFVLTIIGAHLIVVLVFAQMLREVPPAPQSGSVPAVFILCIQYSMFLTAAVEALLPILMQRPISISED